MKKFSFVLFFILFLIAFILICSILIFLSRYPQKSDTDIDSGRILGSPVVIIDAGHGGEDGGTVGKNGCLEKDVNLILAKKLKTMLSSMGIESVLTRECDTLLYDKNSDYEGQKKRLDMQARLDIVRSYDNAVFISIHQNSFPQEKYKGFQIYYSSNNQDSEDLAGVIESAVKSTLQPDNDRVAKPAGQSIYLLHKLDCPALLLECGFLSNVEECELLCDDKYQNELCAVIACGIERYLKNGVS